MTTRIQLRRDTASTWTSNNPTLSSAEIGVETDTLRFKIGDGSTAWNSLEYPSSLYTNTDVDSHLNTGSATSADYLKWSGSDYEWDSGYLDSDVSAHLNAGSAAAGNYLKWSGSDYEWSALPTEYVNFTVTGTLNASGTLQIGGVSITSTAAELNLLDGVTATTTEINYLDGVTSNIQTQLDGKPSNTGSGASGTWGIDITGNAATATSATSATNATQATNATNLNGGQAGIGGNWTIVQSGSSLSFRYNGAAVFSISSTGAIIAEDDVTAFGTAT